MKKLFLITSVLFLTFIMITPSGLFAQTEITVEDLYKKGTFRENGVYGLVSMKDGVHYTNLNMARNSIIKSYNFV